MVIIFKVNFKSYKEKIILFELFIKKNKNKIKLINNNKIKSLESELSNDKLNIKMMFLESYNYELYRMKYLVNANEHRIKIFGSMFVENNKLKCMIIYKNNLFPLQEYFSKNDIEKGNNEIEIQLFLFENISNLSYMFDECDSLEKFELTLKVIIIKIIVILIMNLIILIMK